MKDHEYINQRHCIYCSYKYNKEYNINNSKGRNSYRKIWYHNNPERELAIDLKKYGLTLDQYKSIVHQQKKKCAICDGYNGIGRRLDVDHCHKTKRVRGLLCNRCNKALGLFKDSILILKSAISYLER
jgi:hypothetical protein